MTTYAISTMHGDEIGAGMDRATAFRAAKERATERGESVWVYADTEDAGQTEVKPDGAPRAAIAHKYADPTEDARPLYTESEIREIEREDPSLVVRVTTIAERFAERFGNDGMNFLDADDIHLDDACDEIATREWRDGYRTGDTYRYEFEDGSAIVVAGDAWDIEGDEAFSWAGS